MPCISTRLPKTIPIYRYERCIPLKWRRNVKNQLENHKKGEVPSFENNLSYVGLLAHTVECMLESLFTTLQDHANHGHFYKAFRTFSLIQGYALASASRHFLVGALSFLLSTCTKFKLLREGKQLHAQAITCNFDNNYAFVPKLVSFYTALDLLDDAHLITSSSTILHPLSWNVLISSYVSKGLFQEAIFAYEKMRNKGIRPDHFTYPSVLKACAMQSNLDYGKKVHKSINALSVNSNLFVQNALVSMYGKFGDLETASTIFDKISVKDEVSCNSMISAYISMGKFTEALELFETMRSTALEFSILTWNTVASGCLKARNFEGALELICQMRVKYASLDPVAVVIGLNACSHMCALKVGKEFHGLAIRNSFANHDNVKNSLITLYSRCQDLMHAFIVFRSIEVKSIIAWNSIISGFAHLDCSEEALFLFRELLLSGAKPNYVTLASILPLCAHLSNLRYGKELHCYILRHEEFSGYLLLYNALIEVYSRSGRVAIARKIFDLLEQRDAVTYTSMISAYGLQGYGKVAVKLFKEMEKSHIKPDHVTMVAILSACSHSGLVDQGEYFFKTMQVTYDITPNLEHFACMTDLLGRAGLLQKAKEMILKMPYKPTAEMWATLIGACRIHGNTEIGEWAADKLLEMKSSNSGHYVMIANMYASAGFWSKLAKVRTFMRDCGVSKDPGCAWVDIGAGFCLFTVEDTCNGQVEEIYGLLVGLNKHMKEINTLVGLDNEEFCVLQIV